MRYRCGWPLGRGGRCRRGWGLQAGLGTAGGVGGCPQLTAMPFVQLWEHFSWAGCILSEADRARVERSRSQSCTRGHQQLQRACERGEAKMRGACEEVYGFGHVSLASLFLTWFKSHRDLPNLWLAKLEFSCGRPNLLWQARFDRYFADSNLTWCTIDDRVMRSRPAAHIDRGLCNSSAPVCPYATRRAA